MMKLTESKSLFEQVVHGQCSKPRLAGTGQRGNSTKEASPLEAPLARLNEPSGVAADEGELLHRNSGR
jgi:hypothetical protein